MSSLRHWLWLATRGSAPGMYAMRLLEYFGTPESVYHADKEAYNRVEGLPGRVRKALLDKSLDQADHILHQCEELGVRVLTIQDADYPQRLSQLSAPPCVLYVKGTLPQVDQEAAITLVGARQASPYGVMTARRLGLDLARQGALVVSGTAHGIDTAALEGALSGGGKVLAVLGCGIDVVYPWGREDLYSDVAAAGALLSEYPPGTPPLGSHFPVRNRLLAGLSLGTVVVEGTETSGSLITARWALESDRDVFAVPGNIDVPLSRGPNGLIRRGEAKLIQDAWDILEEYEFLYPAKLHPRAPLPPQAEQARLNVPVSAPKTAEPKREEVQPQPEKLVLDLRKDPEACTDDEAALLRALQGEVTRTADDLVEETGIPARRVMSALTMLQVRQLVKQHPGRGYEALVLLKEETTDRRGTPGLKP